LLSVPLKKGRRVQFSLRWLFGAVTLVAAIVGLCAAVPTSRAALAMATGLFSVMALVAARVLMQAADRTEPPRGLGCISGCLLFLGIGAFLCGLFGAFVALSMLGFMAHKAIAP
jgi:hypothetical protein